MTPINNLIKHTPLSGSGGYGRYYQLTAEKGLKILHGRFDSKSEAWESDTYLKAFDEKRYLNLLTAKGSKFTPKCYGIVVFKMGNCYRVAIILQHLGNCVIKDLTDKKVISHSRCNRIEDFIRNKIQKFGMRHGDIHRSNIMFFQKKFWLIDFTPSYICEI